MIWKVEDNSSYILNQLWNKAKEFESFCLARDDSNDTSDTALTLTVIQGIAESFEVVEEQAKP
jgi:hypothetical protein